jgi:hypothetical protein
VNRHHRANPLNIVFAAWLRMSSDMLPAKGIAAKLRTFCSPGVKKS